MSQITADISDLDGWIQLLMGCKQLPENDVKKLCEKVPLPLRSNPSGIGQRSLDGGKQRSSRESSRYRLR